MKKYILFSFIIALATLTFHGINIVQAAIPPQPTYGTATVDGDASEWNLAEDGTGDFFANMHRAFKSDFPVYSKLYLRYDCKNNILYSLVLTVDDIPGLAMPSAAWIKVVGQAGNLVDGNAGTDCSDDLCFQWVYGTYTGQVNVDGTDYDKVHGWEGAAPLDVDSYKITAHIEVEDSGAQTSGTAPKDETDLVIDCKPTSIELKSFKGKSVGNLMVELEWETASEIDNAGFNLYRARGNKNGKFGKYVKINGDLIPSTGGTTGDHYMYEDQVSKPGNYRYKLEDVANDDTKTRHGPIKVKVRKK